MGSLGPITETSLLEKAELPAEEGELISQLRTELANYRKDLYVMDEGEKPNTLKRLSVDERSVHERIADIALGKIPGFLDF